MLEDSKFMVECSIADEVDEQYLLLMEALEDTVKSMYDKWMKSLKSQLELKFERPIFRWSNTKLGLMEVNYDRLKNYS